MYFFLLAWSNPQFQHRHQRCKAPSLCKTFFITNICRLKDAGQKKYLSHNDFLTTSFSQLHLSQRLFTTSFSHHCPYIFAHTTVFTRSQYTRNLSLLYKYDLEILHVSQIRLSSDPCIFDILRSIKLKP